jgi:hypothetical protein
MKIEIARQFVSLGVDLDVISKSCGLSLEEIRNIKNLRSINLN